MIYDEDANEFITIREFTEHEVDLELASEEGFDETGFSAGESGDLLQ